LKCIPKNLRAAIAGAKAMQFSGLNLTVPHKLLAMQIVDELDESSKTWGAVNTVRFEARDAAGSGSRCTIFRTGFRRNPAQGFNTDSDGIARSLREDSA
jgi:shikimate dehydrogenase